MKQLLELYKQLLIRDLDDVETEAYIRLSQQFKLQISQLEQGYIKLTNEGEIDKTFVYLSR